MHRGCIIMVSMPKCDCAAATIAWSPEVARIDELISKCCRAAHIYGLCLFDSALSVFYIFIPIWIICWLCLQFHWWTLADVKLQLYGVNYSSKTNNLFSGTQSHFVALRAAIKEFVFSNHRKWITRNSARALQCLCYVSCFVDFVKTWPVLNNKVHLNTHTHTHTRTH